MLHNSSSKCSIVICLLTGKSTARSWRVGCSSSAQPIMCQKRCLGNMCKNGFSPIGGYVGKRKRLKGLPFRPNAMNCGFLPQGKREPTLSPLRLGTAGMTLFEQINSITLNILHGVWRSDPPLPSPLPSVLLSVCQSFSCGLLPRAPHCGLLPLAAVWWGSFCVPPWGPVPSWPPFFFVYLVGWFGAVSLWAVLSLPSFVLGLVFCFLSCVAPLWLCLRCVGVSACAVLGVFPWSSCSFLWVVGPPFFCRPFGCCRLPPLPIVASLPLAAGPLWLPGPVFRWSFPLGIWLLLWRPGCLAFVLGVLLCSVALTSFCLMAAEAFGPVWGLFSLYAMMHVLLGCSVLPRWGIHPWWSRSPIGLR